MTTFPWIDTLDAVKENTRSPLVLEHYKALRLAESAWNSAEAFVEDAEDDYSITKFIRDGDYVISLVKTDMFSRREVMYTFQDGLWHGEGKTSDRLAGLLK